MKRVLFLCTGNYYRSRFAEHLFNHLAQQQGLQWRAESRGLDAAAARNAGAISRFAIAGLREYAVPVPAEPRLPLQLELADLKCADRVIAVKEAEHRPLVMDQFPDWEEQIEYWHVDDLDCAPPEDGIRCVHGEVCSLVARLTEAASHPSSTTGFIPVGR
jgi:protein-tyrosine phosphatase